MRYVPTYVIVSDTGKVYMTTWDYARAQILLRQALSQGGVWRIEQVNGEQP